MDKLLLAAFLSTLAGFITAVISVVKLVNEKEAKISDSRRLWNDSLRKSISELTSKLTAITVDFEEQARFIALLSEEKTALSAAKDEKEKTQFNSDIESTRAMLKTVQEDIQDKRHELYMSYAYTRLHFKPNDVSFNRVEQKIDLIYSLQDSLFNETKHGTRVELKAKIYAHIDEMVGISRDILKTEWEIVKKGESAYQKTKKFSIWSGVIMLFLLISIGTHAFMLANKEINKSFLSNTQNKFDQEQYPSNFQCWQIQNINGKILKLNSCTGQLIELTQNINLSPRLDEKTK